MENLIFYSILCIAVMIFSYHYITDLQFRSRVIHAIKLLIPRPIAILKALTTNYCMWCLCFYCEDKGTCIKATWHCELKCNKAPKKCTKKIKDINKAYAIKQFMQEVNKHENKNR
jgi:hypothetical protein